MKAKPTVREWDEAIRALGFQTRFGPSSDWTFRVISSYSNNTWYEKEDALVCVEWTRLRNGSEKVGVILITEPYNHPNVVKCPIHEWPLGSKEFNSKMVLLAIEAMLNRSKMHLCVGLPWFETILSRHLSSS